MANYATAKKIRYPYVVRKKVVRQGAPVIEGTSIQVMDIAVRYHLLQNSPDEILAAYPDLTLSQIYDALSYYYDHKEEMDKEWKDSLERLDEIKKGTSRFWRKSLGKLRIYTDENVDVRIAEGLRRRKIDAFSASEKGALRSYIRGDT